jgi:succinate-semialdehyde dehydrogenase/glutarate-semialdehyde dehydrogenase
VVRDWQRAAKLQQHPAVVANASCIPSFDVTDLSLSLQRTVTAASGLYIDGTWRDGANRSPVIDPSTGAQVGEVVTAGADEAREAVAAAHAAFPAWSALSPDERAAPLRRAYQLVLDRAGELARALTLEGGKPVDEAEGEIRWGAEYLLWYAEEIRRPWGEILASNAPSQRLYVRRRPRGVVACITPWNFPSSMITRKLAPAVAAGNTIVLKPAEQTPLSAVLLFEIFDEAGFPPGVVNLVCGDPAPIGEVFTRAPEVRQVSFTGSMAVGRMLARRCAESGKRASLELGGHAPFVVFADADLELAAEKLTFSKLQNAGQTCIAANRVLVERPALARLGELLVERVRAARIGDGLEPGVTVGPLIDARAVRKVTGHVEDALARGASALCGGGPVDGLDPERFVAPTVLTGVPLDALIATEETFGPVAPLIPFDDEAEAVALANASDYGLAAYLFTRDLGRAHRVGEALEYGMVAVNDGALGWVQAPFGGIKGSGDSREGGRLGLEDYLDVQYLSVNF